MLSHAGVLFQFHTGSIKGVGKAKTREFEPCFNSTLVRLRVAAARLPKTLTITCFNSTLVRLRVCWLRRDRRRHLFQFHTGSIKGKPATDGLWRPQICFNSTLVRLRVNVPLQALQVICWLISFNSTLVRLRGGPRNRALCAFLRFNSTLVRLRGLRCSTRTIAPKIVSIPHWFD